MRIYRVIAVLTAGLCCFAAARSSAGEARPVSSAVSDGVLLLCTNVNYPAAETASADAAVAESTAVVENTVTEDKVVFEKTITTAPLSSDGLYISNLAKVDVNINELLSLPPETTNAEVLILHTHGCEAYTPTSENNYAPTSDFRTTDTSFNVVRIGDEIEAELVKCGIKVIHDKTLCDYPSYTESYDNSLALAKKYVAENPNLRVILDVHRDSIAGANGEQIKTVGAENTAQLMFVVGTDASGNSHPLWRQNLSFALKLQKQILEKYPKLMRPVNLRTHRFNQQVSTGSLIVEVGCDGNTLEEALNAARIFGQELGEYLGK